MRKIFGFNLKEWFASPICGLLFDFILLVMITVIVILILSLIVSIYYIVNFALELHSEKEAIKRLNEIILERQDIQVPDLTIENIETLVFNEDEIKDIILTYEVDKYSRFATDKLLDKVGIDFYNKHKFQIDTYIKGSIYRLLYEFRFLRYK